MEQIYFTKKEAAELMRISVRTLERMIKAKEIETVRPAGGHIRVPRSEMERLAAGKGCK